MVIGSHGIDLIKRFEGCRLTAYRCPAGVWTIGYGHTSTAKPGMSISSTMAENLLLSDLEKVETTLNSESVTLSQNQFDALISFAFNVGCQPFLRSTLWRMVRQDSKDPRIRDQFQRWVCVNGQRLNGLVKRREAEIKLYFNE